MSAARVRSLTELSAADFAAVDRATAVVFITVGALEWEGSARQLGDWDAYPVRLARACGEKLPERWRSLLLTAPALSVQSRTGAGIEIKGYVLRDYLVETCRSLNRLGFTRFVCVSSSQAPRQLTAIEEAAKSIRARSRWELWKRATRPVLMSASSVLVEPARQRRGLWRYRPEAIDRELPTDARVAEEASIVTPKLIAALDGADANRLFRSWYSLIPTNQSTFRAWALALLFFSLMAAWLYASVQALFG